MNVLDILVYAALAVSVVTTLVLVVIAYKGEDADIGVVDVIAAMLFTAVVAKASGLH